MNEDQGKKNLLPGNASGVFACESVLGAKKGYAVPELVKLGDVAEMTSYDVSVIV